MKQPNKSERPLNKICVYCGSNPGASPAYLEAARKLGKLLATEGIGVVFGGSRLGLMGAVADGALDAGGEVIGVLPRVLSVRKEVAHEGLTQLHLVESMHARKALMADTADAFIALPGGLGTLEELAEISTWSQLGMHEKPVGLLNVLGYYDGLLRFFDHAVQERFLRREHREILLSASTDVELLAALRAFQMPVVEKWIDRDQR